MVEMFPQGLELVSSPSQNPLSYQLRQQHACEILSALNIYSFKKIHRFGEYKYSLTHRIFNCSDFFLTQNRLSLSARSLTLWFVHRSVSGACGGQRRRHRAGVKNTSKTKTFLAYPSLLTLLNPYLNLEISKKTPNGRIETYSGRRKKKELSCSTLSDVIFFFYFSSSPFFSSFFCSFFNFFIILLSGWVCVCWESVSGLLCC
jgi:hypothetical protein